MPTRTELIPCRNCGKPRPIKVKGQADIRRATKRLCIQCRIESRQFKPYTLLVPCPQCGTTRPIRIFKPGELNRATTRVCRSCVHNNNRSTTADADEAAVERLLSGQPVRANAAERNQAVAYLTRRRLSANEIARRIGCTKRTVERHRQRLAS